MNNECIPLVEGPYTQTRTVFITTNPVTGKMFVGPVTGRQSGGLGGLSADPLPTNDGSNYTVAGPPANGGAISGVACWDQVASARVPIISGPGTIVPVTSASAISIGQLLSASATGAVQTATTGQVIVGKARSAAAGSGVDVEVELYDVDDNNTHP